MKKPIDRSHESTDGRSEYQQLLDEITNRQLNARNINTYAKEALDDLVSLVDGIVTSQAYRFPLSSLENERRAIVEAGLDPDTVEQTLDHIALVADSTQRLDALIMRKVKLVDKVLVPPDEHDAWEITAGDGSFEKPKERIPKLKTLLLLLETEFNIDLENEDELPKIPIGPVRPNMMRSTSYRLVQLPTLERTVLVCDEVGNTTFVFDQARCDELDITPFDLYELSKEGLKELVNDLKLGVQINYSKDYVDNLAKALSEPPESFDDEDRSTVSILKPKEILDHIPEGYITIVDMKDELNMSIAGVTKRIDRIGHGVFGDMLRYRQLKGAPLRILSRD